MYLNIIPYNTVITTTLNDYTVYSPYFRGFRGWPFVRENYSEIHELE